MSLLALDIATTVGWAAKRSGHVSYGTLNLPTDDYGQMAYVWRTWLTENLWKIDRVVIERPIMTRPSDSLYRCQGLVFVAHEVAWTFKVQRLETTPTEWRKGIFGTGRMRTTEAKKRAMEWAKAHGFQPDSPDSAEALAILTWAMQRDELVRAA